MKLKLMKKTNIPTRSKALDISSATVRVAPVILKALAILSDITVRRFSVEREDLKRH